MDYRYLNAFSAAAKHLNFSKAASQLRIAPSALTRQIQLLEDSLGQQLFIRSPKAVFLTPFGRDIWHRVSEFTSNLSDAGVALESFPLRIGCLQDIFETCVGSALLKFSREDQRALTVNVGGPKDLRNAIIAGELEVLVSTLNIKTADLISTKLYDEEIVLISREKIDSQTLAKSRIVIYAPLERYSNSFRVSRGEGLRDPIMINSLNAVVGFVKKGGGIGLIPATVARNHSKDLHITNLPRAKKLSIYLTLLKYRRTPRYIERFVALLREIQ